MSTEENKAVVRRWEDDLWSQGKLAIVDEIVASNIVLHDPISPGEIRGPEGLKQWVALIRAAFPDLHFTAEGDLIAEGDKVAGRWTARGTHKGDLFGIPPTGKQGTVTGIDIYRFAGGKIEENWSNWDALGLMQQLGVIPAPGQAS